VPGCVYEDRYGAPERRAIEEHKYYLGIELHCDPGLRQAIESWERHHAQSWRSWRMRRDAEDQVAAIETYRGELCFAWGREVDFNEAAHEWIKHWGVQWRRQRDAADVAVEEFQSA
jgi:hypothetical protein